MTPRRALSWSLALLAFFLPLTIAGTNAALALLTLSVLWNLGDAESTAAARRSLADAARSPAFLALAAYAAWEAASALGGLDPVASLRLWPKDAHKLWVFLLVWIAAASENDGAPAAALGTGLALHALLGIGQGLLEWAHGAPYVRAHGFVHPVTFGEILGLGLIVAAALLDRRAADVAGPARRRAAAGIAALLCAALLLNETRAVLVALAAAYAAAALLEARWRRRALWAAFAVSAAVVFWEVLPTGGRSLSALLSASPAASQQRSRLVLWDVAWRAGRAHPLFGVGSGQYKRAFAQYHPAPLEGQAVWSNAHNLFLHQFAERGVPGLAVLLAALWVLAEGAFRSARERADGWALAAWAGTAAFLVMNLTETAFQTEQVATLFLLLWVLGAGPRRGSEFL